LRVWIWKIFEKIFKNLACRRAKFRTTKFLKMVTGSRSPSSLVST
jgi:hypothetical protein